MTNRERFLSIARRTGCTKMYPQMNMCPSLQKKFDEYCKATGFTYEAPPCGHVPDLNPKAADSKSFLKYYDRDFKPGTAINMWGIAAEPGSEAAYHMTRMHFPMANFDSVEQIQTYPFPDYFAADDAPQRAFVKQAHADDKAVIGHMECTIWETAWYMRGMENLMMDMISEDPMAEVLLDKVTDLAVYRAQSYARSGADVIFLGDDIGMQHSIMMSEELYCTWLKPRLAKVIAAARAINPDVLIFYHSCGYVVPFIPHLIDVGVDVLDPVQPECMDFGEIHKQFGDKLSFHGTIGTQTTMPFGTPEEVRNEVMKNLRITGDKGGLYVSPTHLLEPEVPVENVVAYIKACEDAFK